MLGSKGSNLQPLVHGHERGNFLYPRDQFFAPACVAFTLQRRAQLFAHYVAQGLSHVLINAQQDDWGPRLGHPGWTAGGCDGYRDPDGVVATLVEARQAGLSPIVGLLDQRYWTDVLGRSTLTAGAAIRELIGRIDSHVVGYWILWEADEVSTEQQQHELAKAVRESASAGRVIGHHFHSGTLKDNDYWRASMADTLWMQYGFATTDADLRSMTETGVARMHSVGKRFVAAELSLPGGITEQVSHSEAEARHRAEICLAAGADGSLNG